MSALLAPDDLDLGTVAVTDFDALGSDPHAGLPRPSHLGNPEVGTHGAVGEHAVGVVVHFDGDLLSTFLDLFVDVLFEETSEDLEGISFDGVLLRQHVSHHLAHHAGSVITTVVVLGVPKDRCPPDGSSCARAGGSLQALFHEGEIHSILLG